MIHYHWYEQNRRRDKDNIAFAHKFIQDAFVEIGLLEGDGWAYIAGFTDDFSVDSKRPRIEVSIEEVDGSVYTHSADDYCFPYGHRCPYADSAIEEVDG